MTRVRVAVVGGGIAGLSAAWELHRAGCDFMLLEAGEHLGGVIATEQRDGFRLELGPDSFLTQKPAAAELCREVDLGETLAPTLGRSGTWLWRNGREPGRLVPLPRGWMMLAPGALWPALSTPLLSAGAKARLAWRRLSAAPPSEVAEETVAEFLARHFGGELCSAVAAPLLAGVYGGDAAALSAREVIPQMVALEAKGNLLWELRRQAAARREGTPMFTSLTAGLGALPEAIAARLPAPQLRCRAQVTRLAAADGGYRLDTAAGESCQADGVILALPAWAAADLLTGLEPSAAAALHAIPYRGAVTVNLAFPAWSGPPLPAGYGFLAAPGQNLSILACTFVHQKFAGRVPVGGALLRVFFAEAAIAWSDERLVQCARADLRRVLGLRDEPAFTRVARWPRAMAQYTVGHSGRLAVARVALARHSRLLLAGNAYGGIGLPDCIAAGRAAAQASLAA